MSFRAFAVAAIMSLPLGACALGAASVATFQDKTAGEAVDDSHLSSTIKRKLVLRGGYGDVDVEVANGLVLLTGRVIAPEMRARAEQVAWSSRLTREVANEIRVEGKQSFRNNARDEWITARVRSSLVTASKVRSVNFNIETYDGVVYLMGTARTQEELEKAAERASYVSGVKQVVSYVELRDNAPLTAELAGGPSQDGSGATYSEPLPPESEELSGAW